MAIQRALISVSDKTGLEEFAKGLHEFGVELISTGGTAAFLKSLGLPVIEISDYTGEPELFEGRLKTLHPMVHGGLLAKRDNAKHMAEAAATMRSTSAKRRRTASSPSTWSA